MRRAIVLDMDGTLFDTSYIFKKLYELDLKGDAKWDYFHEHCNSDEVKLMPGVREFFATIYNDVPLAIIVSTARNEKIRKETMTKLLKNRIIFDHLYMRKDGDYRPSAEVKRGHLQEIMKNYKVTAFIDDDIENCEMAKELGILVLRKV
jgi:beta-phosphoglucomutase-like phosphatase (HAD superfamily)